MAHAIGTPCRHTGCPAIVTDGSGYCEDHSAERWEGDDRPSAAQRGYDARWRRASRSYRRKQPLCERCKEKEPSETTAAELVHHRTPLSEGGSKYDERNLESLCHACHNREHAND